MENLNREYSQPNTFDKGSGFELILFSVLLATITAVIVVNISDEFRRDSASPQATQTAVE